MLVKTVEGFIYNLNHAARIEVVERKAMGIDGKECPVDEWAVVAFPNSKKSDDNGDSRTAGVTLGVYTEAMDANYVLDKICELDINLIDTDLVA